MKSKSSSLVLVFPLLWLSCTTAKITSQYSSSYESKISRIYIQAQSSEAFLQYTTALTNEFSEALSSRGIQIASHITSTSNQEQQNYDEQLKEFAPDLIIEIKQTDDREDSYFSPGFNNGTSWSAPVHTNTQYISAEISLLQPYTLQLIWQAEVETGAQRSLFTPNIRKGEGLQKTVAKLIRAMQSDGIVLPIIPK